MRAMQMALCVRNEVQFPSFKKGAVASLPSVNDIAVHIDEEWPEQLAVIGRKERQTRLRQLAS